MNLVFVINCKYCGKPSGIECSGSHSAPARDFCKFNCDHCNSRMVIDINVRAKGKSASIKKQEKAKKQAHEGKLRAYFETTEAHGSGVTFDSLSGYDRRNLAWHMSQVKR